MNIQQENRYSKLRTECFYLLGNETDEKKLQYHISGSTRNVYTVTVYTHNAKVFCTCPDAKSWAVKYKCVCKHVLFVLYRVLKVFDSIDHPFFNRDGQTLVFTPLELDCIRLSTEYLQLHTDNTIIKDDLIRRFKGLNTTADVPISFEKDDLCGVCFLELEDTAVDEYMVCPKCSKAAHSDCIKKWTSSGQTLCVYCRQDVWNKIECSKGNYKNLGY